MTEFALEIVERTSNHAELRLHTGSGVRTRGVDRAAVEELIALVEQVYGQDSVAARVFGSGQLRELGERLFGFLDGDERWLTDLVTATGGVTVRISAEQRLRHLPWELAAHGGVYLAVRAHAPLLTVRTPGPTRPVGTIPVPAGVDAVGVRNRPLRVLFMATSPEGVEPVLGYEAEEAAILAATVAAGAEVVVEESGTLDGLAFTAESYGAGYFDVLHLSGHATVHQGQPTFLVEDALGRPVWSGAEQFVRAMAGQWPQLVFVSGCLTASAPGEGSVPSLSESLVAAGAPIVLGWALPVGDVAATDLAAQLYQGLAAGRPVDHAVASARQALYAGCSRSWHLLRVYATTAALTPMVTPRHTPGRERVRVRHAAAEFLDPQTQLSRVAPRAQFVGRRRVIQRCLRLLTQPAGVDGAIQGLVLAGMGGLGKSTLASRLLERLPTYQRVVWFGRVDLTTLRELTDKVTFANRADRIEAAELLGDDRVPLVVRLRDLLDGPLAAIACLFVFDDFEQGNLDQRDGASDGGHVLSPEMAGILPALLTAIRDTGSPSRVVITSRYRFPTPAGTTLAVEALETLNAVEQTKKITNLTHLRPAAHTTAPEIKDRAITAAAGNPRLLDWLDKIVADPTLDVDGLITAIEDEADRFRREDILAQTLLAAQPADLRRMLAKVNVVELPVPAATVHAVHDHPDTTRHMTRAAALGLLEDGVDPETGDRRYFVSHVLRPLLRPLLSDEEYRAACAAAARSLYPLWVTPTPPPTDPDPDPDRPS